MNSVSGFKSFLEVLNFFKDEETCKQYLEEKRWGGAVSCPKCGGKKIYRTNRGFRCADVKCEMKFTVTVGTFMESSKIKLRLWLAAIYLITAKKKGISSHELGRFIGVTQKTAWFMSHRIREALKDGNLDKLGSCVSADEAFIGGKNKNRHKDKKVAKSQGRSFKDKTPVLGLRERNGDIRNFIMADTSSKSIQPLLENNIVAGSVLMTDEWQGYDQAHKMFVHLFVNHAGKQYVKGDIHVNDVENYWSHLKRMIYGTHHWVSRKHLQRYCDEEAYRFNSRKNTDSGRFDSLFSKLACRLKWRDLVEVEKVPDNKEAIVIASQSEPTVIEFKSMSEWNKYGKDTG